MGVSAIIALAPGVAARLVAVARVHVPAADFPALRHSLATTYDLSPSLLKQCDDQTVAALAALDRAGGRRIGTDSWGMVACPCRPGRRRLTEVIAKYRADGPWSVTPHFIPHAILHSMPGLLTQALRRHGPAAGVGGTPGADADALRAAAAWLAGGDLPGLWLVRTTAGEPSAALVAGVERIDLGDRSPVGGPMSEDPWTVIERLAGAAP